MCDGDCHIGEATTSARPTIVSKCFISSVVMYSSYTRIDLPDISPNYSMYARI